MKLHTLECEQRLPIGPEAAWDFFSSPANLEAITPPEMGFRIVSGGGERIHEGQIIGYTVRVLPGIRLSWVTEIKAVVEGKSFIDEQRAGPYRFWHHRHTFEAVEGGTLVRDRIHYALLLGPLGAFAHAVFVKRDLQRVFRFRKRVLAERFGSL